MVRNFLSVVHKEVRGMHQAAYLLAAFALLSQILALVRDRLLAGEFGVSHTLDIYYAAFRLPDFLFATVASLLSLYALLPVLSRLEQEESGRMHSFMEQILLVFFAGMGLIALVLFFLTPIFLPIIAPGITDAGSLHELVMLTRILLLQPILLGASNVVAAFTQLRNRFFLYSVSPLLYNLGIIFGIVSLYPIFGLSGVAWGVVIGAALHLAIQLPFFITERHGKKIEVKETRSYLKEVLTLSVPRTLALATGQIALLLLIALASLLSPGSISTFMFAFNLQAVPLTIIGVSYSVAAFPTLARLYSLGEREEFLKHIEVALRHIIFWSVPAVVFVIVLRAQLVRTILGVGAFDWTATRLTAAALGLFILSLVAQGIALLIARAYYAAGRTRTPLILGIISVAVSVGSALVLVALYHDVPLWRDFLETVFRVQDIPGTTILMLALGYSCGAILQAIAGLYYLSRDFNLPLKGLRRLFFETSGAALIGGAASYGILSLLPNVVDLHTVVGIMAQGAVAGVVGLLVSAIVLVLLKNQEFSEAVAALRKRFGEAASVALEPTEVS